jgi:hypothetical protein
VEQVVFSFSLKTGRMKDLHVSNSQFLSRLRKVFEADVRIREKRKLPAVVASVERDWDEDRMCK